MQPHDIDEYERELAAERLLETVLKYLCVRLRLRADRTFHETQKYYKLFRSSAIYINRTRLLQR